MERAGKDDAEVTREPIRSEAIVPVGVQQKSRTGTCLPADDKLRWAGELWLTAEHLIRPRQSGRVGLVHQRRPLRSGTSHRSRPRRLPSDVTKQAPHISEHFCGGVRVP